jgi:hypothetical protein
MELIYISTKVEIMLILDYKLIYVHSCFNKSFSYLVDVCDFRSFVRLDAFSSDG